jgi:ABC-type transport system involved in multi-copper enzyme maturation permease subunit
MSRILAVASNTVKQVLRMKIAVVFVLVLMVVLPLMAYSATGDGTIKGRLQTFISYGLSLVGLLLSVLTIFAVAHSATSDVVQRQVYMVLTKPIRRHEFLLGKFLGVLFVDLSLLVGLSAVIYGITVYAPRFMGATEEERTQLANEFFTARKGLLPKETDVSEEVEQTYQKLVKNRELDQYFEGVSKKTIIARLTQQKKLEKRAVAVGRDMVWEFDNVRLVDPEGSLFIKFKYDVSVNPPDSQVYGRWMVGDLRQLQDNVPATTPIYRPPTRKDTIRTMREFEVPGQVLAKDGYLAVAFLNDPANSTVVLFPVENGFEVLYKADTFTANFVRAVLLILMKLVFLAALAIFAGSFLSFPVAVLLCLVVFLTGMVSSFVLESFTYLGSQISTVYSYTLALMVQVLPQFDVINPTGMLVAGRLIPWSMVAWSGVVVIGAKALLLLSLGLWIFKNREIAKTTV